MFMVMLSVLMLSDVILSVVMLSVVMLSAVIHSFIGTNATIFSSYLKCCYADCINDEHHIFIIVLSDLMLSVIMLSVVMLNVVALLNWLHQENFLNGGHDHKN
jgi:hypothetical protein